MHLMVVRHGNCLGQCQPFDHSPNSRLLPGGEQQARLTAMRVAGPVWTMIEREWEEWQERGLPPRSAQCRSAYAVSSPLVRALATAEIIADVLDGCSIDVWAEFRGLYAAEYRGVSRAELQRNFPHAVLPMSITTDGWQHGDASVEAVVQRAHQAVSMLQTCFQSDDHVIMVTHGGFANTLLHTLLGLSSTMSQWFALDTCSISRVRLVPKADRYGLPPFYPAVGVKLVSCYDVSHLAIARHPL